MSSTPDRRSGPHSTDTAASALRTLALAFDTRRGRTVVHDAAVAAGRELDELLLSPPTCGDRWTSAGHGPDRRSHAVP